MNIKRRSWNAWLVCIISVITVVIACQEDQDLNVTQVKFQVNGLFQSDIPGGRSKSEAVPASVLVSIRNASGEAVAEQRQIKLHPFGGTFLSEPVTLIAGQGPHYLAEFFVLDASDQVVYATPREGSDLAHLVEDPLDIAFTINKNEITTITPEVLEVAPGAVPADYGYGQFGFKVVEKIEVVFSTFIRDETGFTLTGSHLKIEGLATPASTDALWIYETDLPAKATRLAIKKAAAYRILATKSGFEDCNKIIPLEDDNRIEIIFNPGVHGSADVYVAGTQGGKARYWVNGQAVPLSDKPSYPSSIVVAGKDVYVTGYESTTASSPAFYWKNGEKVLMNEPGFTYAIQMSGADIYVAGTQVIANQPPNRDTSIPVYWKNGSMYTLPVTQPGRSAVPANITVAGDDVYICGREEVRLISGVTYSYPVLWKNGEVSLLQLPSTSYNQGSMAAKVKVNSGHVYIGGTIGLSNTEKNAVYWLDGQLNMLPGINTISFGKDLDVVDGTVYVAGSDGNNKGKYWKNGQGFFIEENNPGPVNLYAISVTDGIVYTAGDYRPVPAGQPSVACYWANNTRVQCETDPSQQSFAYSIFIAKK